MFGIGTLSSPQRAASPGTASAAMLSLLISLWRARCSGREGRRAPHSSTALAWRRRPASSTWPPHPPPDVPTLWNVDDAAFLRFGLLGFIFLLQYHESTGFLSGMFMADQRGDQRRPEGGPGGTRGGTRGASCESLGSNEPKPSNNEALVLANP